MDSRPTGCSRLGRQKRLSSCCTICSNCNSSNNSNSNYSNNLCSKTVLATSRLLRLPFPKLVFQQPASRPDSTFQRFGFQRFC